MQNSIVSRLSFLEWRSRTKQPAECQTQKECAAVGDGAGDVQETLVEQLRREKQKLEEQNSFLEWKLRIATAELRPIGGASAVGGDNGPASSKAKAAARLALATLKRPPPRFPPRVEDIATQDESASTSAANTSNGYAVSKAPSIHSADD